MLQIAAGSGAAPSASLGAALVIVSYSFDGHTVTEGPRLLHAAANATHVTAAAVWSGGLVLLADLLRRRRRDAGLVGPLMRFSQLASVSLVLAGVAGTVMALLVMDRFADLWSTGWGRLLIAKVALVALAAVIGGRNRWVHMPAAAQHVSLQAQPLVQQRLFRAVSHRSRRPGGGWRRHRVPDRSVRPVTRFRTALPWAATMVAVCADRPCVRCRCR